MKAKIILKDNISGKRTSREINLRDEDHLKSCIKYPAIIFKSKKTYSRKQKYKNNLNEE